MEKDNSITQWFGENLAKDLGEKIKRVYPEFPYEEYYEIIEKNCSDLSYTKRIELHAHAMKKTLPESYDRAWEILAQILGEENPHETGMFKHYYWVMPMGKFIEKYGLDDFEISIKAIEEVTKRNTGEYAIRPYIRKYPEETLQVMKEWSRSPNFHLRRLSSEGLRPKLPWATKLDTFIDNPEPVFAILANLMEDEITFVKKSVANHLTDYLKVNPQKTIPFMKKYKDSSNSNTQWIMKHATRKIQPLELL